MFSLILIMFYDITMGELLKLHEILACLSFKLCYTNIVFMVDLWQVYVLKTPSSNYFVRGLEIQFLALICIPPIVLSLIRVD